MIQGPWEVELLDLNFYGFFVCLLLIMIILSLQPELGTVLLLRLSLQVAEKLPEGRGLVWNLKTPPYSGRIHIAIAVPGQLLSRLSLIVLHRSLYFL